MAAAQAAPFDLSVTLSVQGGTLSDTSFECGRSRVGSAIATPSGMGPVTVRATAAGSAPASKSTVSP